MTTELRDNEYPDKWIESCHQAPDEAWDKFLSKYHSQIMAVVKKMVRDPEGVMDAYTYTIDKLRDQNCQKLTSYAAKPRPYSFETWITIVVRKCCLDWFRKHQTYRLPASIQALSPEAQWIFQYLYWHRHSYQTVYLLLTTNHGFNLSFEEMTAHVHDITEALREHTHGQVFVNWQATLPPIPLDATTSNPRNPETGAPQSASGSAEKQVVADDSERVLNEILASMSDEQQLLIQLHFYRGLTYREMAEVLNIKSLWRVRWKLEKTLQLLKKKLRKRSIGPDDLEFL